MAKKELTKREKYDLKIKEADKALALLSKVTKIAGMTGKEYQDKADSAIGSELGSICGVINQVCSVYKWPATKGDKPDDISDRQAKISKLTKLPVMLIKDILEARGNHTFKSKDTHEEVPCKAPNFDELDMLMEVAVDTIGSQYNDYRLTEANWNRAEKYAYDATMAKIKANQEELANHLAFHGIEQ